MLITFSICYWSIWPYPGPSGGGVAGGPDGCVGRRAGLFRFFPAALRVREITSPGSPCARYWVRICPSEESCRPGDSQSPQPGRRPLLWPLCTNHGFNNTTTAYSP